MHMHPRISRAYIENSLPIYTYGNVKHSKNILADFRRIYIHDVYIIRALYVYTGKEKLKSYACWGVLLGGVEAVARMTLRLPRSEREFSANFWPGIWRPFFFSSSVHSAA